MMDNNSLEGLSMVDWIRKGGAFKEWCCRLRTLPNTETQSHIEAIETINFDFTLRYQGLVRVGVPEARWVEAPKSIYDDPSEPVAIYFILTAKVVTVDDD